MRRRLVWHFIGGDWRGLIGWRWWLVVVGDDDGGWLVVVDGGKW